MHKPILIGAIVFAAVCAGRPLLLGIDPALVAIEVFIPMFALFCALSVVLQTFKVRGAWFCLGLALLSPLLSVIGPIYLNLDEGSWEEYRTTDDFVTVVHTGVFAVVAAVLGGTATLVAERRLA